MGSQVLGRTLHPTGDVDHVASRLEQLNRPLGCRAVLSGELVAAARNQDRAATAAFLEGFTEGAPQTLRGRARPVTVWTLAASAP